MEQRIQYRTALKKKMHEKGSNVDVTKKEKAVLGGEVEVSENCKRWL